MDISPFIPARDEKHCPECPSGLKAAVHETRPQVGDAIPFPSRH